jgi:hypothetical protein
VHLGFNAKSLRNFGDDLEGTHGKRFAIQNFMEACLSNDLAAFGAVEQIKSKVRTTDKIKWNEFVDELRVTIGILVMFFIHSDRILKENIHLSSPRYSS